MSCAAEVATSDVQPPPAEEAGEVNGGDAGAAEAASGTAPAEDGQEHKHKKTRREEATSGEAASDVQPPAWEEAGEVKGRDAEGTEAASELPPAEEGQEHRHKHKKKKHRHHDDDREGREHKRKHKHRSKGEEAAVGDKSDGENGGQRSPPPPANGDGGTGSGKAADDAPRGRSRSAANRSRSPGRADHDRGRSPPRFGRSPPPPPRYGRSPPRYGRSPPRYGRGRSPPRRGRSPPRYGRSPPRYGRSPPRYGRGRSPPRRYDGYGRGRRYDDRRGGYDGSRGGGGGDYRPRQSPSVSRSPPPRKKKPPPPPPQDDGKPKRFWDGFQWVDTSVPAVTAGNVVGQATRKDRRLYVGNLPMGAGLTEKQLSEFISTAMKQRGMMPMDAADPVMSVWLSPEGTYAFVEFHTVDYANLSLGLNGINLLTSPLRISRPNNYQPMVGTAPPPGFGSEPTRLALPPGAVPAVATGQDAASLALAAAAALAGGVPLPMAALGAMPGLAAAVFPVATSRIISCSNMLTPDELAQEVERDGLKEDVAEECQRFGKILAVKVPASSNPECCAYIKFDSLDAATQALRSLAGRKFDGRTVGVLSVDESVFDALVDGTAA